jgi:hypothetical protein
MEPSSGAYIGVPENSLQMARSGNTSKHCIHTDMVIVRGISFGRFRSSPFCSLPKIKVVLKEMCWCKVFIFIQLHLLGGKQLVQIARVSSTDQ